MKVFKVRNVADALSQSLPWLLEHGARETSRNGSVLVAPEPVTTVYEKPLERVLFCPTRDANPFFHLFEALWMLAGRNDLAWPKKFNSRFGEYSDDGITLWGAYGWRWRSFFSYDQIDMVIKDLVNNPNSRRAVVAMWNAYGARSLSESDLFRAAEGGKDVPCNTHAYFDVRGGALNMTVCCRSNDVLWGAYGANVVHFSLLLEHMAERLSVPVGVYRQMSNNFHVYTDIYSEDTLNKIARDAIKCDSYSQGLGLTHVPLNSDKHSWQEDLREFFAGGVITGTSPFIEQIARPMLWSWDQRKNGNTKEALDILYQMPVCDWRLAAIEWTARRLNARKGGAA